MHLIGRNQAAKLSDADPMLRGWITHFLTEVMHANWKRENDVKNHFPRCVRLSDGTFAFPIPDAGELLYVAFSFRTATAVVLGLAPQ